MLAASRRNRIRRKLRLAQSRSSIVADDWMELHSEVAAAARRSLGHRCRKQPCPHSADLALIDEYVREVTR